MLNATFNNIQQEEENKIKRIRKAFNCFGLDYNIIGCLTPLSIVFHFYFDDYMYVVGGRNQRIPPEPFVTY